MRHAVSTFSIAIAVTVLVLDTVAAGRSFGRRRARRLFLSSYLSTKYTPRSEPPAAGGTAIAFSGPTLEVIYMFAVAAILIGIVGILYVRRRSTRKKQQTAM